MKKIHTVDYYTGDSFGYLHTVEVKHENGQIKSITRNGQKTVLEFFPKWVQQEILQSIKSN